MQFEIPRGTDTERVTVPDPNLLGVLEPNETAPVQDTDAELGRMAEGLAEFVGDSHRVLVLVNDYTRPTPNAAILERLEPVLEGKDVRLLVCLGTHRPPEPDEFERIFGPGFYSRYSRQVACHDCRDRGAMFFKGKTKRGTGVWFNRALLWAERIVAVNSVEPHYFAGYTGGRKSFLPGVAAEETITANHNLVVEPGAAPLRLEGNPVHEDMAEAAAMLLRSVFSVQAVLDRGKALHSLYWGDLVESFERGTRDSHDVYAVPVEKQADVVLSVLLPPYDINFYQSQRAVEFARPLLKNEGIHITVSSCPNGIGNDGFIRVFSGCRQAGDVLECMAGDRRLGWHKSARLAQLLGSYDLYTVVGVDDDTVRSVFMQPFGTVQEAVDTALRRAGAGAGVYVIPDAGGVVPVLST